MHILYDNGVAHMTVYLLAWKACKSVFVLRIELNEITVVKYWKKYPMQCVFSMNGKCMLRGSWELVL